ncbi:MAG: PQQ-like beta-propeller repeat protein [Proteobacteria bacterium]|nr:PQQ-like beta-propeller repeat protein [Pseudomonadota bacterium]
MNKRLHILIFLLLIVNISSLAQAPDIVWVSTYNGSANGYDETNDLTVDNSGNLYAVGQTFNGTNADIIIIKYNTTNGDTIWTRVYNGNSNGDDLALGCVLDNSGNLYVVGGSYNGTNKDFILIKYNASNGDIVWMQIYNGTADGDDIAYECAFDGSGNIYVTGTSYNGTNNDYLTIKYNASNGDTIWTRRYDGTANGKDEAFGCALDGSGNLYVSGYSYNGSNYNIFTIKYNENGDIIPLPIVKTNISFV